RRVALAHRNRAREGKRAGNAPYGMANDGLGGLKHGKAAHIKIVRRIFERFARSNHSLNQIASDLNADGIPAPRGGKWFVDSVKGLLVRPAYRGDFVYGQRQQGRFYTTTKNQEVVEATKREAPRWKIGAPAFRKEGAYKPLVSPATFDAAQKRLASF